MNNTSINRIYYSDVHGELLLCAKLVTDTNDKGNLNRRGWASYALQKIGDEYTMFAAPPSIMNTAQESLNYIQSYIKEM